MTVLEQKVDAIARSLLVNDFTDRNSALADLRVLMEASSEKDKAVSVADAIDKCLLDLGVPERIYGYRYLQVAITKAGEEPKLIHAITSKLYPAVARECDTTSSRAERAIRHAVETGWDRCDPDMQERYFGGTVDPDKAKPTNGEYIAKLASVVRKETQK